MAKTVKLSATDMTLPELLNFSKLTVGEHKLTVPADAEAKTSNSNQQYVMGKSNGQLVYFTFGIIMAGFDVKSAADVKKLYAKDSGNEEFKKHVTIDEDGNIKWILHTEYKVKKADKSYKISAVVATKEE